MAQQAIGAQPQALSTAAQHRVATFVQGLFFVAGFATFIVGLFGLIGTVLGDYFYAARDAVRVIGGIALIVFGLFTLRIINIPLLYSDTRRGLSRTQKSASGLQSYLTGLSFAAGWTPCIGPTLGAILGLAALQQSTAQAAGLPSVLVENFTWDWIYEGYAECAPVLRPHIETLRAVFASADRHVQTEPVCAYTRSDLLTAPVCRSLRLAPNQVREKLDIPASAPVVLITMGGLSSTDQHAFFDQLAAWPQYRFVIPGGDTAATAGNVLRLPNHSAFYHPDIMRAADAVVGKTGYSTVAEAYHAGLPYGYVSRPRFRESGVMERYIQAHMRGIAFGEEEFRSGAWLKRLPDLLALGRMARDAPNGAEQIADFLLSLRQ